MKKVLIVLLLLITLFLFIGVYNLGYYINEDIRYGEEVVVISRFRQLEGALNEYYEDNGKFPPTRYQRNPGEPFHSWRVLLLPYLSDPDSHGLNNYNFKKEWDDIENIRAIGEISPILYTTMETQKFYTNILAVGPDDQWTEKRPLKSWVVRNGVDSFILFEKPDSKVKWAMPVH